MVMYLNKGNDAFIQYINSESFVDKSMIIKYTNENLSTNNDKFMCVTRFRRSGKSMMLSMLNAYYSKGADSKDLFKDLKIYNDPSFESHLNKHNVFYIDITSSYLEYKENAIKGLTKSIIRDLNKVFPNVLTIEDNIADAIVKINSTLNERFIFLIDEWDCIYRESYDEKLKDEYTNLLRGLFNGTKCSSCIDLVYMTGILPIRRYNNNSPLNNFIEYNMITPHNLGEFMGFTDSEVKSLCDKFDMSYDEINKWYNGYKLNGVGAIYNPLSVVRSINYQECNDYWVSTCDVSDLVEFIKMNNGELKIDFALLLAGGMTNVDVSCFCNDIQNIKSKDDVLTLLIHLGYLAYDIDTKSCYIPNFEVYEEIEYIIKKIEWYDILNLIKESHYVVNALLYDDIETIAEMLKDAHIALSTEHTKTNEGLISIIFDVVFCKIRSKYYVYKELNSSIGVADVVLIPKNVGDGKAVVIELKYNKTVNAAIAQIKEKGYLNCLSNYSGDVKLIGINYSKDTQDYTIEINETVKI